MPANRATRNVTVDGRRTSLRMENAMWEALEDICRREDRHLHEICGLVHRRRAGASFTAAMRVFIVRYYRTLLEGGNAMEAGTASLGIAPPEGR
jgi:predicted DNA-binding ribbon-helix-helix protein